MNLKTLSLLAAVLFAMLLISCGNDESSEENAESNSRNPHAAGNLVYNVPDGWVKETPASRMRRAQYKMPGQDGAGDGTQLQRQLHDSILREIGEVVFSDDRLYVHRPQLVQHPP